MSEKVQISNNSKTFSLDPKRLLKNVGIFLLGVIATIILSPYFSYMLEEQPELQVLFDDPLQFKNSTEIMDVEWQDTYVLYTIEIIPKSKSKQIEDINILFSFDAAIINIIEDYVEGATGYSLHKAVIEFHIQYEDYIEEIPIDTSQVKLVIEKMPPKSVYRFNVIVDPKHEKGWMSPYLYNDTYIYDGFYYYNTQSGQRQMKIDGSMPYLGEKSSGFEYVFNFN